MRQADELTTTDAKFWSHAAKSCKLANRQTDRQIEREERERGL